MHEMFPTTFPPLLWLTAYILIGGVCLWALASRLTQDGLATRLLLGSYAVRLLLGLTLYATSLWHWPLMKSLQIQNGFWAFGPDAHTYHYIGSLIDHALRYGVELPRLETSIEYYAVVAAIYRLFGAHPVYPIIINCWLAAATGLLAYLIAGRLADRRVARVSATLVSLWPSSFVWSAQLLKDALCWVLLFLALWLVIRLMRSTQRRSWPSSVREASQWLALIVSIIGLTKLRFYVGLALSVAVLVSVVPAGVWAFGRQQVRRGLRYLGVAAVVCLSMVFARTLPLPKLLAPAHPERGHFQLAVSHLQDGNFQSAEDAFVHAISLKHDYREAYLGAAAAALQLGRMEQAIWAYTRVLLHSTPAQRAAIKPVIASIYLRMGNQHLTDGQPIAAVPLYEEALSYDPLLADARVNLGLALAHAGDFDQALVVFSEALRGAVDEPQRAVIRSGLAQAYMTMAWHEARMSHWNRAVVSAVASLHLDAVPRAFAECGIMMAAEAHELDDALTMATRALELSASRGGDATPVRLLVARLYRVKARQELHRGNESALNFYRDALRLDPDPEAARELSRLLEQRRARPSTSLTQPSAVLVLPTQPGSLAPPAPFANPFAESSQGISISHSGPERPVVELAVALFSSSAGEWSERAVASRQQRHVLAHLNAKALEMRDQAVFSAQETTPEALAFRREGFVSTGGHSLMDAWAKISSPRKLVTYLPKALLIGFLAPFPSQWFDVKGSTGFMRIFAGFEMVVFYLLLPSLYWGLRRIVSIRRADGFFLVAFVLATAVPLSLVVANLGTLFRLRLLFLLPLLIVAAVGDPVPSLQRIADWLRGRPRALVTIEPSAAMGGNGAMAAEPLVSVVMPAYNAAATITAAIHSVLRQTYPQWELIVVDDGSTDGTARRVLAFGDRVRYLRQEHLGPGAARNRGVAEARGHVVAFLDADDLWLPEKLERQMTVLRQEPTLDAVQCGAYLVSDALEVIEHRRCRQGRDTYLDALLFRNMPALASTLLARKPCLEAIGGFSTDREEVWDFGCRLLRRHRLRSLPESLVLYRQHAGNRSHDLEIFRDSGIRTLQRVFADPELSPAIRRREMMIWARFYAMLAGGYFRHGDWAESLRWTWRALVVSPSVIGYVMGFPLRRVSRLLTARKRPSFAAAFAPLEVR